MFAALTAVRHREAVTEILPSLLTTRAWKPPDDVSSTDLPLAHATKKTLTSMHKILTKTAKARELELTHATRADQSRNIAALSHERKVRASEVRVVQCMDDLKYPTVDTEETELFQPCAVD